MANDQKHCRADFQSMCIPTQYESCMFLCSKGHKGIVHILPVLGHGLGPSWNQYRGLSAHGPASVVWSSAPGQRWTSPECEPCLGSWPVGCWGFAWPLSHWRCYHEGRCGTGCSDHSDLTCSMRTSETGAWRQRTRRRLWTGLVRCPSETCWRKRAAGPERNSVLRNWTPWPLKGEVLQYVTPECSVFLMNVYHQKVKKYPYKISPYKKWIAQHCLI